MLTPTEAARLILQHIAPLPAARRPLREALDRVLAEDVTSPIDLPAWDNSAMDGYAARAADVERAGPEQDRKSTRLNSSHQIISYAVFCLKKKMIAHSIDATASLNGAICLTMYDTYAH